MKYKDEIQIETAEYNKCTRLLVIERYSQSIGLATMIVRISRSPVKALLLSAILLAGLPINLRSIK